MWERSESEQMTLFLGIPQNELHALFIPPYTIPQSGSRFDPGLDAHLPSTCRTNRNANSRCGKVGTNDSVHGNSLKKPRFPSISPHSIPKSGSRLDPDLVAHLPNIRRTNWNANSNSDLNLSRCPIGGVVGEGSKRIHSARVGRVHSGWLCTTEALHVRYRNKRVVLYSKHGCYSNGGALVLT